MNDSYKPKNKFSKFMAGKGFYVALAVCVVGAGTAAWVAVDKTITRIDDNNQQITDQYPAPQTTVQERDYGFPDLEEAGKAQSDVAVPPTTTSEPEAPATTSSDASEEVAGKPDPQPISFVMPVFGEIFTAHSNGELVKNVTLREWRTHDGVDIKADLGTEIKAVYEGKVLSVKDDPLMGTTVEIQHDNDIVSIYCGLEKEVNVAEGETVKTGQILGTLGEIPAEATLDPHLHFAMKAGGKWVDPIETMGKKSDQS